MPFALLSLMETESYASDISWMAKRMGVSKRTIQNTLNRLTRLGMVILDKKGHYQATGHSFATPEFIASEAMKLHHLQNLELARQTLDHLPVELRYFSSMTMTIDPARLPEAKKALQSFRDEFCQKIEKPPKREVYRLVLQFFPISKAEEPR